MGSGSVCTHSVELPHPSNDHSSEDPSDHLSDDDPGVHNGVWHCPRNSVDGFNKCVFHLSPENRPEDVNISQAFLDHLTEANEIEDAERRRHHQQFIDVEFDQFNLRGRVIGTNGRSYVDFRYSKFSNVDCSRAEFCQRMCFSHCTFAGQDDIDATVTEPKTRYDFSGIESILFKSVDFRYNVTFTNSTFEAPVRFHGNQYDRYVSFKGATFQYPADFEMSEFSRMAAFRGTEFLRGARFCATKYDGYAWFSEHRVEGPMFWYGSRFRNDVTFDESVFAGPVSFEQVSFEYTAEFSNVLVDDTLTFEEMQANRLLFSLQTNGSIQYVNLIRSEVLRGEFKQPDSGAAVYDFTDALLGDVLFNGRDDQHLLNWIKFYRTRFDGFDFTDSDDLDPAEEKYRIHHLEDDAETVVTTSDTSFSPEGLVTTYVAAKNTSTEAGNSVAAGSFFYREMIHRRKSHWNRMVSTERSVTERIHDFTRWIRNGLMSMITGYGEHPDRVIYTSAFLILLFAVIYTFSETILPGAGFVSSFVFSLQSFVTLIFGDVPGGTSVWTRFVSSIQGFLGAFLIALFVFTLTRRVHR